MKLHKIDASIDRQIITGMVVSTDFIRLIAPVFKPIVMLTPFAVTVAEWCLKYFKEYDAAPGKHIQDIFECKEREGMNAAQAETISQFLASLSEEYEKVGTFNVKYLYDVANKLFRTRILKRLFEDGQILLERGQLQEAEEIVRLHHSASVVFSPSKGLTAKELFEKETKEIGWVIKGMLPEGLMLLAGKPKVGKSYFMLDAAIGVSTGSEAFSGIPTESARVLYLALEDPEARIKDRLKKMLKDKSAPDNLHIFLADSWPRIHEGGMEQLEAWMENHPDTRLVIVDTLERFKRPGKISGYFYSEDYQNLVPLQAFANKYQIGVIVIHHTKKTSTKDPFDEITGTVGLTAAADTLAKLDRGQTGQSRIFTFRGRDVGEGELSFRFEDFGYILEGVPAEQFQGSESRRSIINYLKRRNEPVSRKELVEEMEKLGVGKGVDTILGKMVTNGDIKKTGYGAYAHAKWVSEEDKQALLDRIHQRLNFRRKQKDS